MAESTSAKTIRSQPSSDVVDDAMARVLREKSPAERLKIADEMWRFARDMIRENVRAEHPEWNESDVERLVARRLSHGTV